MVKEAPAAVIGRYSLSVRLRFSKQMWMVSNGTYPAAASAWPNSWTICDKNTAHMMRGRWLSGTVIPGIYDITQKRP
jgi:hypothetical protein